MIEKHAQRDRRHLEIGQDIAGARLDKALASSWDGDFSRSRIKQLIESGAVEIGGALCCDPSQKVRLGDIIRLDCPAPDESVLKAQSLPLKIFYEDHDLIVIDKPAGMVVHPAPGNPDGTLVNALLGHCGDSLSGIGGVKRPGIVHRIDKDTSGLLVVAKNDQTHRYLSNLFHTHDITRVYKCVVWGLPSPKEGIIDGNIGRHRIDRKKMSVRKEGGKPAVTAYRTEKVFGLAASLLTCRLQTGRTHQIRVHLAAIGHPLIGDQIYGKVTSARKSRLAKDKVQAVVNFPRQALHAAELGFSHPKTGKMLHWESPVPEDMIKLLNNLS